MSDDAKSRAKAKLGEWIEEEETVPVETPIFSVSENGKSLNFEGIKTVEKKVKHKVAYASLSPLKLCAKGKHYFEFENKGKREGGRVHVKCVNCPIGGIFRVGIDKLENGKMSKVIF